MSVDNFSKFFLNFNFNFLCVRFLKQEQCFDKESTKVQNPHYKDITILMYASQYNH